MAELYEFFNTALNTLLQLLKWGGILSTLVAMGKLYYQGDYYGVIKTGLMSAIGIAFLFSYPKIVEAVSRAFI